MPRPAAPALVLAVLALVTAACSDAIKEIPPPPSLPPTTSTVPPPDLSEIALRAVPGQTTTTSVPLTPGGATMGGVVMGPDGPVPGATVRLERLVEDAVGVADVVAQPDGSWQAIGILGGRYRVRAWRAPDLALTVPQVLFLEGAETKEVKLELRRYVGVGVEADLAPSPAVVGQPAALEILVAERTVDEQGVVRATPIPRIAVELYGSGAWRLTTPSGATTDGQGRAGWQLTCRSAGKQELNVLVGGQQGFPIDLPACEAAPPSSSTTTSSTVARSSTTSTTKPPSSTSSTTSTTR